MLHLTVASAALKNRGKSIEKPLDLNETRFKRALWFDRDRQERIWLREGRCLFLLTV